MRSGRAYFIKSGEKDYEALIDVGKFDLNNLSCRTMALQDTSLSSLMLLLPCKSLISLMPEN